MIYSRRGATELETNHGANADLISRASKDGGRTVSLNIPVTVHSALDGKYPCPGIPFTPPPGQNPFLAYPVTFHRKHQPAWSALLTRDAIILRSYTCRRDVILKAQQNLAVIPPCADCAQVLSDPNLAAITRRNSARPHENTPLEWLNTQQLVDVIHYKGDQLLDCRTRIYNDAQKITVRDQNIDEYKLLI